MTHARKTLAAALVLALGLAVGGCGATLNEPGSTPVYPGLKGFGSSAGATSGAAGGAGGA